MSDEHKYLRTEDGNELDVRTIRDTLLLADRESYRPAPPYPGPHDGPLEGMEVDPTIRPAMRASEAASAADEAFRLRYGMSVHIEVWSKMSAEEKAALAPPEPERVIHKQPPYKPPPGAGYDGNACDVCGNFALRRSGSCLTCEQCGTTTGCS
jgi:hypothetical protein